MLIAIILILAPPFQKVWKITPKGFVSEEGEVMRLLPEAFLKPKETIKKYEGKITCVALLVEYSNRKFQVKKDFFRQMLNGVKDGEPKLYPYPSFREFWEENSYGKFSVETDVLGPVELSGTLEEYACGSKNRYEYYCGLNGGARALIEEALQKTQIDFSKYDNDGDGAVDCFFVIHAGMGGEATGKSYTNQNCCDIWSHANALGITAGNKLIASYIIAPSTSDIFPYGNMGVIAHEFGHLLGLQDLYDTGQSGLVSCGVGPYSLMGFGVHTGFFEIRNGKPVEIYGTAPSHLSPWEKVKLGWGEFKSIQSEFCSYIPPSQKEPYFIKAWNDGKESDEYFIVEYRGRIGFDSKFPNEGAILWRIDEKIIRQKYHVNMVNNDECYPGCKKNGVCQEELSNPEGICPEKHYGISVLIPKNGIPFRFEKMDQRTADCSKSEPGDFWRETSFPDIITYEYSLTGDKHKVFVAFGKINDMGLGVAISVLGNITPGKSPGITGYEKNDWVEPGKVWQSEVSVYGSPPIILESISELNILYNSQTTRRVILESPEKIKLEWVAPTKEGLYNLKLKVENCVESYVKEWNVKVMSSENIVNETPEGCSCSATNPSPSFSYCFLYILIRKIIGKKQREQKISKQKK